MTQKHTYTLAVLLAAMLIFLFLLGSGAGFTRATAFARSEEVNGGVLADLQKDTNFTESDYPAKDSDYSLLVIQISESIDGELFVYVYQPCAGTKDLRASSMNISRYPDNTAGANFQNYELKYCSSSSTLYKYQVVGFDILKNAIRYYNVSSILRPYDKTIDGEPENDNTVSEVPNRVGQCWVATTLNGDVTYDMTYSEVIEIKNKYVGYVNYNDGTNLGWAVTSGVTSSHFVAFSTDKDIDKLISASLTFNERNVTYKQCNNALHIGHGKGDRFDFKYGAKTVHEPNPLKLQYTEKASNAGGGNINKGNKYEWNRIQTTKEFLSDKDESGITITKTGTGGLKNTEWVLNFYETSVTAKTDNVWLPLLTSWALPFVGDVDVSYTEVSDVMILELEFEQEGRTYKLGTIDNKQTGSNKSVGDNIGNSISKLFAYIWRCAVRVFSGKATTNEKVVFGITVVVAVVVLVLVVKFLKWALRGLFK